MVLRLQQGIQRGPEVTITIDGTEVAAFAGESIAAAMIAASLRTLRHSPRDGAPRGVFCFMGSCQECVVLIDGRRALACQESAVEGMTIKTGSRP